MYKTSDLCLASTLESIEIPVSKITMRIRGGKKEAVFWFENSPDLEIAIKKYWERSLRIEPRLFNSNLKGLKGRIYEA